MIPSKYIRWSRPDPPPPVPTVCERVATNQRGSLRYLTMNEILAAKDVDVWEGADSMETGTHQKYMYEAEAGVPMPVIEGSATGSNTGSLAVPPSGLPTFGTLADDIILAFMTSIGGTNPLFTWDLLGNWIIGTTREEVIDAGQDVMRLATVVAPGPETGAVSFAQDVTVPVRHIAQFAHITGGALDVYASSEAAGASPSLTITPTFDDSIVVGCVSYQGTAAGPAVADLESAGWVILHTETAAAGGLNCVQVLCWRQVPSSVLITLNPTITNHDGSNTTTLMMAAITGTGGIDSIWQQWILMKDVSGSFTPGEVLALQ